MFARRYGFAFLLFFVVSNKNCKVYFSLSSHESFSRTNSVLDLSGIYDGLMEFFESSTPAIAAYTKELLAWWNR